MLQKITKPEALELFAKTAKKEIARVSVWEIFYRNTKLLKPMGLTGMWGERATRLLSTRDENTVPEFILPAEFAQLSDGLF